MTTIFLHGLDSSSYGNKASWFRRHFPEILIPDFNGPFSEQLAALRSITARHFDLMLIGSSFGGLMAAVFALEQPQRVKRLVLLAPALNFPEFSAYPASACPVPTLLYIGRSDTVCPPEEVLASAFRHFTDLSIHQADDDHLLRKTFSGLDWTQLLSEDFPSSRFTLSPCE